jgi:hypothetical protein
MVAQKMNNALISILLFSVISLMLASSARAYVSFTYTYSLSPSVVEPGSRANIILTLNNVGTDFSGRTTVTIAPTSAVNPDTTTFDLQTIKSSGSAQIVIPVSISLDAAEGTNVVPFKISYSVGDQAGSTITDGSMSISITKRTLVQLVNVTYDKETIQRGDTVSMTLIVENAGKGQIRDLVISLRNFSLPIAPLSGDTEKFLGTIGSGTTASAVFDFIVNTNAETIAYTMPVTVTYYDGSGTYHSDLKFVGMQIYGKPEFVVNLESIENAYSGGTARATISISNRGTGSAKFLSVNFDSGLQVMPKDNYVGDLDPDDSSTIGVDIDLGSIVPGRHSMVVVMHYKDSYNKEFVENAVLDFDVGMLPFTVPLTMQIIIAGAVIAILYWKRSFIKSLFKRK